MSNARLAGWGAILFWLAFVGGIVLVSFDIQVGAAGIALFPIGLGLTMCWVMERDLINRGKR